MLSSGIIRLKSSRVFRNLNSNTSFEQDSINPHLVVGSPTRRQRFGRCPSKARHWDDQSFSQYPRRQPSPGRGLTNTSSRTPFRSRVLQASLRDLVGRKRNDSGPFQSSQQENQKSQPGFRGQSRNNTGVFHIPTCNKSVPQASVILIHPHARSKAPFHSGDPSGQPSKLLKGWSIMILRPCDSYMALIVLDAVTKSSKFVGSTLRSRADEAKDRRSGINNSSPQNPAVAIAASFLGRACSALHPTEHIAHETGIVVNEAKLRAVLFKLLAICSTQ
jgi:hypothetical protein